MSDFEGLYVQVTPSGSKLWNVKYRLDGKERNDPATNSNPFISSQERETLLKLIEAMACEQYGYDPREIRSSAVTNMGIDLAAIGQSLDRKTIRKWLKEATDFVENACWAGSS